MSTESTPNSETAKTVLITGGSGGLGLELSRLFAADGYRLLWVSNSDQELKRGEEQIRHIHPDTFLATLCTDLTKDGGSHEVYSWARDFEVDVLVNNAGFGTYGYLQEIDTSRETAMIQLNIVALYELTRLFLEDMESRGGGRIVNISSSTALQPVPRMATYAATKSFVKQFSESLNEELRYRNSGVKVTTVCPAAIGDTNFSKAADMQDVNTFSGLTAATVAEVAADTYLGMNKGKLLVITGSRMRLVNRLRYWIPNFILKAALKKELDRAD